MKTNSIQGTSFNGVRLVGSMPKLQQKQANKLLSKIKKLPGYDLTDKNGITFLISSKKDKSKLFPRRIFNASSTNDMKTDVAKLLYLANTTFDGKSSKILKYIADKIEEIQRTTDKVEKINTQNHAIKSMLDELKPENIVIMWGDKTMNEDCEFMYYDKQKKCANRITREDIGISTPVLKHEEFANGFECDETHRILYFKNKLRSETYSFSGRHTIDDFYPNGNICTHKEYNGGDWEEITYDELGRMKTLHKEEYGIYITDEKYNPETGEIIECNIDTL